MTQPSKDPEVLAHSAVQDLFLQRALAAELEAQILLQQSGLGQPPGRYPGDFEKGQR
jgi:hypothetical protein